MVARSAAHWLEIDLGFCRLPPHSGNGALLRQRACRDRRAGRREPGEAARSAGQRFDVTRTRALLSSRSPCWESSAYQGRLAARRPETCASLTRLSMSMLRSTQTPADSSPDSRRLPRRERRRYSAWVIFRHFPRIVPFVRPHWKLAAIALGMIGASVLVGLGCALATRHRHRLGDRGQAGSPACLEPARRPRTIRVARRRGRRSRADRSAYGLGIIDKMTTKLSLSVGPRFPACALQAHLGLARLPRSYPDRPDRLPAGAAVPVAWSDRGGPTTAPGVADHGDRHDRHRRPPRLAACAAVDRHRAHSHSRHSRVRARVGCSLASTKCANSGGSL